MRGDVGGTLGKLWGDQTVQRQARPPSMSSTPRPSESLAPHQAPSTERAVLVFLLGMLFGIIVLVSVDWMWPTWDLLWP